MFLATYGIFQGIICFFLIFIIPACSVWYPVMNYFSFGGKIAFKWFDGILTDPGDCASLIKENLFAWSCLKFREEIFL